MKSSTILIRHQLRWKSVVFAATATLMLTVSVQAATFKGNYADRQISQLSGGQQQRVFLARALAQDARLYFMDEPFAGVDVATERAIIALLKELKAAGKTCVVVHHDLQTVPTYFDHVVLLNMRLVATGPVSSVFNEENLKKPTAAG